MGSLTRVEDGAEVSAPSAGRAYRGRAAWHGDPRTWQSGGVKNTSGISAEEFDRLDGLVREWLPLPDVAEQLGLVVTRVHGLVDDGTLLAVRNPHDGIRRVPAAFLLDGAVLDSLRGTVAVLRDSGFTDVEAIAWLFTEDDSLPGRPVDALRDGRKTEIRRRAQALAW